MIWPLIQVIRCRFHLTQRFKQEYSDLMKQKNEIQSIKSSIKNNVISPNSHSKSIESSNINLYSSDEFLISNHTELSSNNTIELEEIDSNTMSDSNFDMYCIKFYGMLDELNNEITKLKELFSNNTDSNSFCNSMNFNNYNTNRSTNITEMSAGEDFIDNEEYESTQRNTIVEQMMHRKSTDHDDHDLYSNSKFDTNHNNKDCCTNAHCSMHSYNPYYCD
ncbi:putative uncharacterized protein DDB_G0284695 [Metopolophium dirhodum]|uniref:putative uncharacterized protein DDB_G0284695 n=1 Tax=Metopolophium dirhodum TaxID=44670 RepID=UPI00298FB40F|nr:putative uncharacterized protein DDB_G0284695 [Metopolophium dirhodum]